MPGKILIFGGSFDPPHTGHLALLRAALEVLRPDLIFIVPAYQAPLKSSPLASGRDRLRLARLGLFNPLPPHWRRKTLVADWEIRSRRRVYTFETIRRIRKRYPKSELHFAAGSDAAARFRLWRNPKELKASCRWWSAERPGESRAIPAFFGKIPGRMPQVSSTAVRATLALGEIPRAALVKSVADDIEANRLYGLSLALELKSSLAPERFAHTLAVAKFAQTLAERWDENPDDARLAGLLHDLGRSIPITEMPRYALKQRLKVPARGSVIQRQPLLLHAYISEDLSKRRGLGHRGTRNAIRRHTLGDARMTRLDRILYVADACSPDRSYPGAAKLRRLALTNLDQAFSACVRAKISHALARGGWIHPLTISLWNNLAD